MTPDDITTLMESADPVDASEVQGWVDGPEGQRILADIMAEGLPARRHDGRRLIIPGVVAILLLATGAATYLLAPSSPTTEPRQVGCYAELSMQAETALPTVGPSYEGVGAAGICAAQWPAVFGEPAPRDLVTCIVEGGGVGVFPNAESLPADEACSSIGASLPKEGLFGGISDDEFLEFSHDLGSRVKPLYEQEDCAPAGQLIAAIQGFLRERGLTEWRVVDETSSFQEWTFPGGSTRQEEVPRAENGELCAVHGIDPVRTEILVINGWPRLPEE